MKIIMKHDQVAKRPFPKQILINFFNCNNTSLNDILTKISMVAYFEVLFLFLEKINNFMKPAES